MPIRTLYLRVTAITDSTLIRLIPIYRFTLGSGLFMADETPKPVINEAGVSSVRFFWWTFTVLENWKLAFIHSPGATWR